MTYEWNTRLAAWSRTWLTRGKKPQFIISQRLLHAFRSKISLIYAVMIFVHFKIEPRFARLSQHQQFCSKFSYVNSMYDNYFALQALKIFSHQQSWCNQLQLASIVQHRTLIITGKPMHILYKGPNVHTSVVLLLLVLVKNLVCLISLKRSRDESETASVTTAKANRGRRGVWSTQSRDSWNKSIHWIIPVVFFFF